MVGRAETGEFRVGDNWRNRYHALTLHNQVHVNHLPYMPFPPNWPKYIAKDKIAGWFEAYAESMELNFWTGTEFAGGSYDERDGKWSVVLKQADGKTRKMHPRHVVMATGVSGIPSLPSIASLKDFAGQIIHSSEYDHGSDWTDSNVLIIGTGNSGHDIAQDLHSHGRCRRVGRNTLPRTRSPAGSRPMPRAWSSTFGPAPNSPAAATTNGQEHGRSC